MHLSTTKKVYYDNSWLVAPRCGQLRTWVPHGIILSLLWRESVCLLWWSGYFCLEMWFVDYDSHVLFSWEACECEWNLDISDILILGYLDRKMNLVTPCCEKWIITMIFLILWLLARPWKFDHHCHYVF